MTEFYKRMEAAILVCHNYNIPILVDNNYGLKLFLEDVASLEDKFSKSRCVSCYKRRMERVALVALSQGFDAWSTSLLYSKMQQHDLIKDIADSVAKKHGIPLFYHDFREGWQEGIDISKELEIYRQNYCACIISEEERFATQLPKKYKRLYEEIGNANEL